MQKCLSLFIEFLKEVLREYTVKVSSIVTLFKQDILEVDTSPVDTLAFDGIFGDQHLKA